jgi:beta-glucosidase
MKYIRFSLLICLSAVSLCVCAQQSFPFRNTKLSVEERAKDIVSRLSLEEKVAQMMNTTPAIPRLGIPAYDWWSECLHGVARTKYHVTVYPQAVGMAAAWDAPLLQRVASAIGDEGRAIYNDANRLGNHKMSYGLTYWSPNINIFRDPRWGRGQETYGEDPFLTGTLGKAFVRGLQGNNPRYLKAAACAKHFAVHSGPEPNRHSFDVNVSTYDLWDTYLPAFRDLVVDAKVAGVMCAYNAFQTQPCCGNDLLMNSILRKQWKFTGYVTSDCGAIADFYNFHKTHPNAQMAAIDAVSHGTDVECGNEAYVTLVKAVKEGAISESQLDVSLVRLFSIRLRLGLFDPENMVPFNRITLDTLECKQHQLLAKRLSRESIVLLKNEKGFLPLNLQKLKKVVIVGPNADNSSVMLGNYFGIPTSIPTPLQSIRERLGSQTQLVYLKGADYIDRMDADTLNHWMSQAEGADVAIFIGGISAHLEGEQLRLNREGFYGGDRTTVLLPGVQTSIIKSLQSKGIPVVFVMMTGSAIAIPWEAEHIPAILNAWYGGQYGGKAIADVLFGDYNPSGKLPVTFYAQDSDLPDFESYDMAGRTYRYFKGKALYPFGYGLSYTHFTYSNLVFPKTYRNGALEVKVTVKNDGKVDGEDVAQLYVSHLNQKVLVPITALKSFQRIHLKAGESRIVSFKLSAAELSTVDEKGDNKLLPGTTRIDVGGCSPVSTSANPLSIASKTFSILN